MKKELNTGRWEKYATYNKNRTQAFFKDIGWEVTQGPDHLLTFIYQ